MSGIEQYLQTQINELKAEIAEYERTVAHMRDGARLQDSATAAVMERAEKAEAEMKEQCRLLAIGSEREVRLMANVAELLHALEGMSRQHCFTDKNGETDSGAISANADALEILARHGKFKIDREGGRMVCGHWPEAMRGTE